MTDAEILAALKAARIKLVTGAMAEEVDFGTYRTKFMRADMAALDRMIADYEGRVTGTPARGAISVIF